MGCYSDESQRKPLKVVVVSTLRVLVHEKEADIQTETEMKERELTAFMSLIQLPLMTIMFLSFCPFGFLSQ